MKYIIFRVKRFFTNIIRFVFFIFSFFANRKRLSDNRFAFPFNKIYPCLNDKTTTTSFDPQYLYHTSWAARILYDKKPELHVDISSCLRFVTLASAFVKIDFYDYRPADIKLSNLKMGSADLTNLHFEANSIKSLSCMHVIEHIGLGRYGDEIDPQGDLKSINELKRVLAKNGYLYFVVPLGEFAVIQYNAHRIYSYDQIIEYFSGFNLEAFAYITEKGEYIEHANKSDCLHNFMGCGCFLFRKQ